MLPLDDGRPGRAKRLAVARIDQEWANVATHAGGLVLAVIGTVLLARAASRSELERSLFSVLMFGSAASLVYLASTLHHALRRGPAKTILLGLDYCGIYLLIAATYTPFALLLLQGDWALFAVIWSLAALGIAVQVASFASGRASRYERIAYVLYLVMGWAPVAWVGGAVMRAMPASGFALLAGGGIAYTIGVVFYCWRRLRYGHAIWHLFAVAGTGLHGAAIATLL